MGSDNRLIVPITLMLGFLCLFLLQILLLTRMLILVELAVNFTEYAYQFSLVIVVVLVAAVIDVQLKPRGCIRCPDARCLYCNSLLDQQSCDNCLRLCFQWRVR